MKAIRYALYAAIGVLFLWTSGQLFFEKEVERFFAPAQIEKRQSAGEKLRVATPYNFTYKEPFCFDCGAWRVFSAMTEPLVRLDENLKPIPALALSWGRKDDKTWEFSLRRGVKFHDGSTFSANDAVATFNRYNSVFAKSESSNLLSVIEKIEAVDDFLLRVTTVRPDPLLLGRLSLLPISHGLIGTGPFRLIDWAEDGNSVTLGAFADYWGEKGNTGEVKFMSMDGGKISTAAANKEIDLALDYLFIPKIAGGEFTVSKAPGLNVSFMPFNSKSPFFKDKKRREAFSLALDLKELLKVSGLNVLPANQFVAPGVFGFNPQLPRHEFDLAKAKNIAEETGMDKEILRITTLPELKKIMEYIKGQMEKIGVKTEISVMSQEEFAKVGYSKETDLHFLGYKAQLGDSAFFLADFAATNGTMNLGGYYFPWIDTLLRLADTFDYKWRLENMQEAMKILVEEDPFGIPLFVDEDIYIHRKNISFKPRPDGQIYFNELTFK